MTAWLLVGFSRFARRRVIPALASLAEVTAIHVASVRGADAELAQIPKLGRIYRDYEQALAQTPPAVVYVSLTNDAHAAWAERALELGHHVVIDKPAFTELAAAERLVAIARARSLVIAEATTWTFHPQVARLEQIFDDAASSPKLVTLAFTPPLPADNFRMQRALGGGALLDTGPYVASLGRVLWGAAPTSVYARVLSRNDEVDTSYSVLVEYGEGRGVVGHLGFTTEYRNWLHLAGTGLAVEAHGMFSTPPDVATELTVRQRDATTTERVPPAFAMQRFLAEVLSAIGRGDTSSFSAALLADARVRDALLRATQLP